MEKRGISLITLAITILVMAILTTVIVMTTNNSGIIKNSKNTVAATNLTQVQELAYVAWTNAQIEGKTTASELDSAVKESLTASGVDVSKYNITVTEDGVEVTTKDGIVVIPPTTGGTTPDTGDNTDTTIVSGITASVIKANPSTYYGMMVEYNSKATGTTWQVLHSDGTNIYLIAADYVNATLLPSKGGKSMIVSTTNTYIAAFLTEDNQNGPLYGYAGATDITDSDMIALNAKYHKYLELNNLSGDQTNMMMVAYLLDKDIWTPKFTDGSSNTKYVIGGPSVELLFAAHNLSESTEYETQVSMIEGYDIREKSTDDWISVTSEIIAKKAPYVITDTTKATYYWLSSPGTGYISHMLYIDGNGNIAETGPTGAFVGFRPVVCLSEGTRLEQVGNVLEIK